MRCEDGLFRVRIEGGEVMEGDGLLVATDRRPNTEALHAPPAGIELDDRGFVRVNERLETTRPGVYAIGEAAGQPPFTHVSWEDYRRILANLNGGGRTRDDRVLGYAVFTDPQLGRAGLSMDEAKEKGYRAREETMQVKSMARAIEWGHEEGFYQMVIDKASGRILGATLVGYEAAELVHALIDLMETGARAKMVLWNGPMGVIEVAPFAEGTNRIAQKMADLDARTIVGGGDTGAAVSQAGVSDRLTHISTGGGGVPQVPGRPGAARDRRPAGARGLTAMSELTRSPQWRAMELNFQEVKSLHMRDLFSQDPRRFEQFSIRFGDLLFDYSKNRITRETMHLLLDLARQSDRLARSWPR